MIGKDLLSKIKDYLTLGSANLAASGINAVFWMYLASLMDKSEYGMLGYLISIATVSFAISTIGLPKTIVVYGAKNENVISPAYTLGLISSTIASIVVFIITQNIAASFLIWGMMIFGLKTSDLNSKKRYREFAMYKIIRSGLIVTLGFVLFQFFGINGVILGFALATLPALTGLYQYAKNKKFSIALLKPKAGFMINNWFHRISNSLFWWGDKIIIGLLFGFTTLGGYHLAAQYLLLLQTVPQGIFIYLLPHESVGRKNKKIKIFSVLVSAVLVLGSILFLPYAIDAFFPKYQESILPAQIMSVALIPLTISLIFESQFIGREKPRIALIGMVLQTITYFALLILLGAEYGIFGIAIAFLIATVIRFSYNTIVVWKFGKV